MSRNGRKNEALRVYTSVDSYLVQRLRSVGRRVAMRLGGIDPEDASQQAIVEALTVLTESASRGSPLTDDALIGRVRGRLLGHRTHVSPLFRLRGCCWEGLASAEAER